jgi:hypothetical protein
MVDNRNGRDYTKVVTKKGALYPAKRKRALPQVEGAETVNTNDQQLSKRRCGDHEHSLRVHLSQHREALAKFQSTGDLAQQEWAAKYLVAARLHAAIVVELGGTVRLSPSCSPSPKCQPRLRTAR